jgi:hypothetical protein
MFQLIVAIQPLVVGAVLVWAAAVKLFSRHAAASARRSALVPLIGERRAVPAYRLLGGVELTVGTLLVLPPALLAEAVAGTALYVGFLGYLGYARTAAPESSCGCLSSRRTPISWRSFGRSSMLVLASLVAMFAAGDWLGAVASRPLAGAAVLLIEAAAVIVLSPELDSRWLLPLRRLRARLTHPLRGGSGVPLLSSVQQLQQSGVYRQVAPLLRSDVREHWDDEEWRMVCHAARYQGRGATAVFAVPRLRYEPDAVRVAIVDDLTGVTLLNLETAPADSPAAGGHDLAVASS